MYKKKDDGKKTEGQEESKTIKPEDRKTDTQKYKDTGETENTKTGMIKVI